LQVGAHCHRHIVWFCRAISNFLLEALEHILTWVFNDDVVVTVGSDDAQAIAQYQRDPDIAFGVEAESIDSCSCTQIVWPKYFFAGQAPIGLYAETHQMIHVGFYDV